MTDTKTIVIVGGGFGGVACAQALAQRRLKGCTIRLISDKPHMEYTPALYRVVTGRSPLEVCIPLKEVFADLNVDVVIDTITGVDTAERELTGSSGSRYAYDYLVLALGSQTNYFNIPGLDRFSYGFKSIKEALRLKEHITTLFRECASPHATDEEKMHFVIVGAGPSGVELTGELACYTNALAREYGVPETIVTLDLIEASQRILPSFPYQIARRVEDRLRHLGVNIFTARPVLEEESEHVDLKGLAMKTSTVIWTAGITPHALYRSIQGLTFDEKGRVAVDAYLRAGGHDTLFIIGDGASTLYSGMAQTALRDAAVTAKNIARHVQGEDLVAYQPHKPYHSLPVGPGWAVTLMGPLVFYGAVGWFLRRLADLKYFLSILPLMKAFRVFSSKKTLCAHCSICAPALEK